jgi:hypothetical protein
MYIMLTYKALRKTAAVLGNQEMEKDRGAAPGPSFAVLDHPLGHVGHQRRSAGPQ